MHVGGRQLAYIFTRSFRLTLALEERILPDDQSGAAAKKQPDRTGA